MDNRISFIAGVAIGNRIIFSNWMENGLYSLDLETGSCELLDVFLMEKRTSMLHNAAVAFENKIFFIPTTAKNIACYDINLQRIHYIELPVEGHVILDENGNVPFKFDVCQKDQFCWMTPIGYNIAIKLDMMSETLTVVGEWPVGLEWRNGLINFQKGFLNDKQIIISPYKAMFPVSINIETNTIEKIEWKHEKESYGMIICHKGWDVYVPLPLTDSILCVNRCNREEKIIPVTNYREKSKVYKVYKIIDEKIVLFPLTGKNVLVIDMDKFETKYFSILNEEMDANDERMDGYYQGIVDDSECIYVSSDRKNKILKIKGQAQVEFLDIWKNQKQYGSKLLQIIERTTEKIVDDWSIFDEKEVDLEEYLNCLIGNGSNT